MTRTGSILLVVLSGIYVLLVSFESPFTQSAPAIVVRARLPLGLCILLDMAGADYSLPFWAKPGASKNVFNAGFRWM